MPRFQYANFHRQRQGFLLNLRLGLACEAFSGFPSRFIPKVLQDVDLERAMIHAVAAELGVALVPEQVKKFEHENVVFRQLNPTVRTEGCVAWKDNNPSVALKAYVQIVEQVGRSIR